MKTFSEYSNERAEARREAREEHVAKLKAILESAEKVTQVHTPNGITDKTDYERWRNQNRTVLRTILEGKIGGYRSVYEIQAYDFVCDHCGTQLVNMEAGAILTSSPPQRHVHCLGCGWHGYTRA